MRIHFLSYISIPFHIEIRNIFVLDSCWYHHSTLRPQCWHWLTWTGGLSEPCQRWCRRFEEVGGAASLSAVRDLWGRDWLQLSPQQWWGGGGGAKRQDHGEEHQHVGCSSTRQGWSSCQSCSSQRKTQSMLNVDQATQKEEICYTHTHTHRIF